jgi:ABC-type transport system substrate-binding protein
VERLRHPTSASFLTTLVLSALLATSAAGCTTRSIGSTTSPSTTTTTTSATTVFENGGTAVVAVPSLPTNFNPSTPTGANRITNEVMAEVLPQAFVTNSKKVEVAEPGFVLEAEVEGVSPFTVVYTLNPKAVWSDGSPIGVDDFIYNWQEQLQWAARLPDAGLAAGYRAISSITSSNGGAAVTLTFKTPFPDWQSLFSNLIPEHIASQYGWVKAFEGFNAARVISGGPFEITSYQAGHELTLSRNPRYWGTPARLSQIVLQVATSPEALKDLEDGKVSAAELPNGSMATQAVTTAATHGLALSNVPTTTPVLWQLCFNTTSAILGSPIFRDGIADSLYVGEITADSVGLDDPGVTAFGFRFDIGETLSGAGGIASGLGGAGGSPSFDYDTATALADFQSAGYVLGSDGLLSPTGTSVAVTLRLLVPSGIPDVIEAAEEIKAQLAAAGLEVVIRSEPLAEMLGRTLPQGNYELALAPFLLSTYPTGQATIYSDSVLPESDGSSSSSGAGSGGGSSSATTVGGSSTTTTTTAPSSVPPLSWGAPGAVGTEPGAVEAGVVTRDVFGYSNAAVTTDLQDALTNLNPDDAASLIRAAETQLSLDVPTVPLFRLPIDCVHDTALRYVTESPTLAGIFWDASTWAIQVSPPVTPPTSTTTSTSTPSIISTSTTSG